MLGPWGSSKQTGLEGLEVLHAVDTGDVGTTGVSEVQGQRLQGWGRDLGVEGPSSRTCQRRAL